MAPTAIVQSGSNEHALTYEEQSKGWGTFDHVTWYVSNAKQAATAFCTWFGLQPYAYMGLETGSRDIAAHAVRAKDIIIVFVCALRNEATEPSNAALVKEIHEHVKTHGDAIKDIAFSVSNVEGIYHAAISAGARSILSPQTTSDKLGQVSRATVVAFGQVTHTLVDRRKYNGFLPGYRLLPSSNSVNEKLPATLVEFIDHAVGNQNWNEMNQVCDYYKRVFGFHQFFSFDDKTICTEFSSLRSVVMASPDERIKMPINEPAEGKRTGQIEEFYEFYAGPGIQHLAFHTNNIIETIRAMRHRGVEFIDVPASYYDIIRSRLANSPVQVMEDLAEIQRLNILIDFDDKGYLLQLFTKPLLDRPTVFIEIIQRHGFDGFGAGNFKSLFESIEREQILRGTLNPRK